MDSEPFAGDALELKLEADEEDDEEVAGVRSV